MAGEAMKCPECQIELPDGFKFCNECGTKLELTCPGCGKGTPPESKFCPECGHNLRMQSQATLPKDLSSDEKLAKIQKHLPGGLIEKILSQRTKMEGERRHVSIMYVDNDFIGLRPYTKKLLHGIIEENFDFTLSIFARVEIARDSGILSLMRPAGSLR
jgi:Double zinc ribbon